jgi:diacylglycerol kinase (ATP)
VDYFKKRQTAFYYAFRGLGKAIVRESHMRIHCGAALLVVLAGFYFRISRLEWLAVLTFICLVPVAELFNTVAERVCDLVTTEQRPEIAYIKDISAAAVLIVCIAAVIAGLLVFLPYLSR